MEDGYVPIRSAILDKGTATSVERIWVPSGSPAKVANNACFLADHRDSMLSWSLASSKDLQL